MITMGDSGGEFIVYECIFQKGTDRDIPMGGRSSTRSNNMYSAK